MYNLNYTIFILIYKKKSSQKISVSATSTFGKKILSIFRNYYAYKHFINKFYNN